MFLHFKPDRDSELDDCRERAAITTVSRSDYRRVARRHRITRSSRCPSNASGRPKGGRHSLASV